MNNHLHIICLNVPYPVDYGGVFDLFYKLPALQKAGVKIHLHCFDYGRGKQEILNRYCENVYYYPRKTGIRGFSFRWPYIVSSRRNNALCSRLLQDEYPILMEGIHCTWILNDNRFQKRSAIVRLHNIEHIYYEFLYKKETSLLKKIYYRWESYLLEKYEKEIAAKAIYLTVSFNDEKICKAAGLNAIYLPLFLPDWQVKSPAGKGSFCLYHGDLSIPENEFAAIWLLKHVFVKSKIPFVAAGKNPSLKLKKLFYQQNTTCLIENPSENEMQDMISKAHINIIPSFNKTGIKLKLLNALYNGRFCITNSSTTEGTGLEGCCILAETEEEFLHAVQGYYDVAFSAEDVQLRKVALDNIYNNEANAIHLARILQLAIDSR